MHHIRMFVIVTVMFPPAVALVCAAAGPQALSSLRPPGLTEEEASACRALHHQRYMQKEHSPILHPNILILLRVLAYTLRFSPSASKLRGTSAA